MNLKKISLIATSSAAILLGSATLASADVTTTTVPTWAKAATTLGADGSLWQPTFTAGLKQSGGISVSVGTPVKQFGNGAVATYKVGKKQMVMFENWAGVPAAVDPTPSTRRLLVGNPTIKLGGPDTPIAIKTQVSADCYTAKAKNGLLPAPPANLRCKESDVSKYGGELRMTAKPSNTMGSPGNTDVVIQVSPGVSYQQLLKIASELQQVAGL
ncbi:MAG: hypothetical protein PHN51_06090 [Candidatus Nanopelagicales bacterium]|nr:hypothetical protein [Candidatus Nanopelagicales bacterium]